MKNFLTYLLLCVYLVFSTGWNINVHYCGGKLASLGFSSEKMEGCCSGKSISKKNNCCKDEVKIFKSDENQQSSGNLRVLSPSIFLVYQVIFQAETQLIPLPSSFIFHYGQPHAPPSVPLYLRNCLFTI